MLTIIASMDYELSGLRMKLGSVAFAGKSQSRERSGLESPPDLRVIGVGKERAQASVRRLLEEGSGQTDGLLLLGVAGAVDPTLDTGDLVLSSRYFRDTQGIGAGHLKVAGEKILIPDPSLWELATKACAAGQQQPFYLDSLTVGRVVSAPEHKKSIAGAFPVGIVEMEDYWVAEVVAEFGVAFLSARVVLDTADQALPGWLLGLARSKRKAVMSLAARPWRIPAVVRLARQRPVAQKSLTRFALNFLVEAAKTNGLAQKSINSDEAEQKGLKVLA